MLVRISVCSSVARRTSSNLLKKSLAVDLSLTINDTQLLGSGHFLSSYSSFQATCVSRIDSDRGSHYKLSFLQEFVSHRHDIFTNIWLTIPDEKKRLVVGPVFHSWRLLLDDDNNSSVNIIVEKKPAWNERPTDADRHVVEQHLPTTSNNSCPHRWGSLVWKLIADVVDHKMLSAQASIQWDPSSFQH